eukprot:CAMPEP_0183369424 /NCGR_PEP_ID=MMETSP0164_2-20130417/99285_1 /TAXON_ID=221442 /ORGANISM="Coccolithus pelagicus ssp braarudi, Strain PLY182g" /LENGTH=64 /DNA_ID=CAMNT_0025545681 /DNA_START=15 /DNA_END=205 /DNA_ORIENTATION=-
MARALAKVVSSAEREALKTAGSSELSPTVGSLAASSSSPLSTACVLRACMAMAGCSAMVAAVKA